MKKKVMCAVSPSSGGKKVAGILRYEEKKQWMRCLRSRDMKYVTDLLTIKKIIELDFDVSRNKRKHIWNSGKYNKERNCLLLIFINLTASKLDLYWWLPYINHTLNQIG